MSSLLSDPACLAPVLPLVGADLEVPLVDGRAVRHANLDGAASAPALVAVAERVTAVLPWYGSVHRGAGYASQVSTTLYEQARETLGRFVGARTDDVVVLTRNTTDATNLLASAVPGRVLVLDVEHHANLLPWRRRGADVVVAAPTVAETLAALEAQLAARMRTEPYALLAVTAASNVTGEALPLDDVVALARRHGARVFADGAQLLAHRRLSLAETGVDYVAFSGHKLYAPFGAGALVGPRDWFDAAEPHLAGGGAVRRVGVDDVEWTVSPARHEGGTPNLVGAVALATATDVLASVAETALEHERALTRRLVDGLEAIRGVEVARLWSDSTDRIGVASFRVGDADPGLVATFLAAEHGVSVRDGRFCAHPLLDRLGWATGAVRASIGVGTSADDVDRLLTGVADWVEGRASAQYVRTDGVWTVQDDPRPTPEALHLGSLVPTAGTCT